MEEKNKKSDLKSKKGLSRRKFIRGAGLTTAGSVLLTSSAAAFEGHSWEVKGEEYGPGPVNINMKVNGTTKTLRVEPRTTLSSALRDHMSLTGTKVVCDRGS